MTGVTSDRNDPRLTRGVDSGEPHEQADVRCRLCAGPLDGPGLRCKSCKAAVQRQRYRTPGYKERAMAGHERRRREDMVFLLNHLAATGCTDCGERDPVVLEFDHVDGKRAAISAIVGSWSRARLIAEMARCEVRCANCHARRTAQQLHYYQYASFGPNFWPGGARVDDNN